MLQGHEEGHEEGQAAEKIFPYVQDKILSQQHIARNSAGLNLCIMNQNDPNF